MADRIKRIYTLLFCSADIGHDAEEITSAMVSAEAAGNLGFYLDHTQVALRLIVVKRDGEILYEQAYCCLAFFETVATFC